MGKLMLNDVSYSSGGGSGTVFTGATSSSAGTQGEVPAPQAGDQNKYLKGDGTWATPSGGGGGGSSVIPNPTGTPTDTLDTISIDGTIYEIQGSGGGSGQSTVLLDTPITTTGTYTLADDYTNYDIISILAGNGTTETDIHTYTVGEITSAMSDGLTITNPNTGSWFNFTMNADEVTITGKTVNTIYKIVGYKFGGGGGGSGDILIAEYTEATNAYGWLYPKDVNGNALNSNTAFILSLIGFADMSGSPPYYNGLDLVIDSSDGGYLAKVYDSQTRQAVTSQVTITYKVAYTLTGGNE